MATQLILKYFFFFNLKLIMHKVTVTVKWMTHELFISLSSLCPGEDPFYHPLGAFDPPEPLYASTEYQPLALDNSGVLFSDHFGDVISEFTEASGSSADWEFSFPVSENVDSVGGPGETKRSKNWCCCTTRTHKNIMLKLWMGFIAQKFDLVI